MATTSSPLGKGLGLVLVEFQYEYQGRDGELVSIKPNERYVLLAKTNDHWWQVCSDGGSRPFYIPAKYVKELPLDLPSPLDFANSPSPEPKILPVAAPVPVVVPVPKTLEETNENKTKSGDELTIRLRPDASSGYRKTENRMSTFGVPLDLHDLSALVAPTSRHSGSTAAETRTSTTESSTTGNSTTRTSTTRTSTTRTSTTGTSITGTTPTGTTMTGTTMTEDPSSRKQLPGFTEDLRDSEKHRVPSFSPADPLARPHTQPIPVEIPVVPTVPPHDTSPTSLGLHDTQDSPIEPEDEDEEISVEESSSEEEVLREEHSNHIYESIQDLNLDMQALLRERAENPGAAPDPAPNPAPDPVPDPAPDLAPHTKDPCSPNPNSPIYANICSLKKTSSSQVSVSDHASTDTDHAPSSSHTSCGSLGSTAPLSPQDDWQELTDDSGRVFYFHPMTRRTTWSDPRAAPPPPTREAEPPPSLSPASPPGWGGAEDLGGWKQLLDPESGKFYYHHPASGTTRWAPPSPASPASPQAAEPNQDDGPPPLPEEDYPLFALQGDADSVFTTQPGGLSPIAQPELKDEKRRQQELPTLPQRLMGNGVSEEAAPVRSWRHSIAEDSFAPGHRRNVSDFTDPVNRRRSPDSAEIADRLRLRRNLSDRSVGSRQGHLLEKAGITNKTKVADNGKKIRKNWSQSWTVLHGGILTFHRDPKSAPSGTTGKTSQIVPEFTVELRGASVGWASKDKSSKKNVLELRTRQGCEYLMQYDTESIISDWLKVIQDTIRQLDLDHLSEDEDEASDREDKDRKRMSRGSSSGDSEQRRVRTKLRRFLQRRPTLQSVKERGYIRDNVFGCHLDTLCHRENCTIPRFVDKCVRAVERRGLDVDGIYRVSGNLAVIQKLRHKADHEEQLDLEDGQWQEIHVITGALKLFLRELPEPLFPFSCFEKFIAAIQVPDYGLRVSYMKDLVRSLPLPNHDTMELLFRHLRRVVEHKESNRMSVQSLAIVFGPTLLRPQTESANMTVHMVFQSQIVELMLNEYQTVFSKG